jgi:hypothetical protein
VKGGNTKDGRRRDGDGGLRKWAARELIYAKRDEDKGVRRNQRHSVRQDSLAVPRVYFRVTSGDGSIIGLPWLHADLLTQRRTNRPTPSQRRQKLPREETARKELSLNAQPS